MNPQPVRLKSQDGWTSCRVADVCEYPVERIHPKHNLSGQFTYIDISSIDTQKKLVACASHVDVTEAPSRARQLVQPGDVLVSTTRPNLNAVALIDEVYRGAVASTGFCVLRPSEMLSPSFLYYFVRTSKFIENTSSMVTGALYPAVTDRQVLSMQIPFPPLPEQKRIVAILNEQMAAVEKARAAAGAQLEAAKALPAAYLREVFSDRDQEEDLRDLSSSVRDGLPVSWHQVALGEVCSAIRGVTFASSDASHEPTEHSVACLTTSAVQAKPAWSTRCFIPADRVSDDQIIRAGDILVSTANSKALVGKSCLVDQLPLRSTFGAFVTVLRPLKGVSPKWVSSWMHSGEAMRQFFTLSSNTTNISNLRVSDLLSVSIPLPPLAEQKRIVAILNKQMAATEKLASALETQLNEINALPASLLRQAFSGAL
jgi:type I restriction enzyme, S subunit